MLTCNTMACLAYSHYKGMLEPVYNLQLLFIKKKPKSLFAKGKGTKMNIKKTELATTPLKTFPKKSPRTN